MYWNHRVVDMTTENEGNRLFEIREVSYEDNGIPIGHTEASLVGETMEELKKELERMKKALDQPVLSDAKI